MAVSLVINSWMVLGLLFALQAVFIQAEARAFFVLGDSLVDGGNNNNLITTVHADSPPYGVDYQLADRQAVSLMALSSQTSSVRPANWFIRTPITILESELRGLKLLKGANFASAGVGILNDTGIQFVNIIRMLRQFDCFEQYQQRLSALIGVEQTRRLVNQALILIIVGGNIL